MRLPKAPVQDGEFNLHFQKRLPAPVPVAALAGIAAIIFNIILSQTVYTRKMEKQIIAANNR
jgi:hypothetical protein